MHRHDKLGPIEWAVAGRPLSGQPVSGDYWAVADAGAGVGLFAVIDGLGHGVDAANASRRAARVLGENPGEPLDVLMLLCHRAIGATRGAAMSIAHVDFGRGELSWLGIGNVSANLVGPAPGGPATRSTMLAAGGIVGYQLPAQLHPVTLPMRLGDLLVLATDGITGDHLNGLDLAKPAESIAEDALARCAKDTDDALVLVARHRGNPR